MINRDVSQLMVVPALVHNARFHSCTVAGFTCYGPAAGANTTSIGTSEMFPGFVIDRLGLPYLFHSLTVAPVVYGSYGSTGDGTGGFPATLTVGIAHASASGGTYAAYSTGDWLWKSALWRQTTATSTANVMNAAIQRDVGLTSEIGLGGLTATATSTAAGQNAVSGTSSTSIYAYVGPGPIFDLTGAQRYIKVVMRVQLESSDCGTGTHHMSAAAIFGEPQYAQPGLPSKRVLVTTGCAT